MDLLIESEPYMDYFYNQVYDKSLLLVFVQEVDLVDLI